MHRRISTHHALGRDLRWLIAAGGTLVLHAALLSATGLAPGGHANKGGAPSGHPTPTWWLTTVSVAPAPGKPTTDQPPAQKPAPAETHAATASNTSPTEAHARENNLAKTDGTSLDEAPYWSRNQLDQGPVPLEPVVIPYPDDVAEVREHTGLMALFVDEHGTVRRVEARDQHLPPPMVLAARNAFLQARFQPGQRQGQAVRSHIVIEVVFEPEARGAHGANRAPDLSL